MPSADLPPSKAGVGVEPVGVALIGPGKWGRVMAKAIGRTNSMRLVTCCGGSGEKAKLLTEEFGGQMMDNLTAALRADGVEAAIVTSPSHTHLPLVQECVEAGRHVFVEKPMALRLGDGQQMARLCTRAGLVLMVGHEMRRLGASRAMKQVLRDRRLGRVVMANAVFSLRGTFQPDNWRCHRESNRGGALMQLGIHHIETLQYLFGPVSGVLGRFAHVAAEADIDDVGIAQLEFENGTQATVSASYVSPPSYEIMLLGEAANLRCRLDMRAWPDAARADKEATLTLQTRDSIQEIEQEPQDVLALQLGEFARCVRRGDDPETGAPQGLAALSVVEAALESWEHGTWVDPRGLLS